MTKEEYVSLVHHYDGVLDRVKIFAANNTGYATILRRAAGKRFVDVDAETMMAFYQAKQTKWDGKGNTAIIDDKAFLAACLQCLWKADESLKTQGIPEFGSTLKDNTRDTFQKRMLLALDTSWDTDGYLALKLFRLVKFCKSQGAVIDCKLLLHDLFRWDSDSRIVQKNWIHEFLASND